MTVLGTWESKMNVRPLLSSKFLGKPMERQPVVQPAPKSNHEGASTTLLRLNSREKQFILNWKSGSFRQRQWALHWAPHDKSGAKRLRWQSRDLHESKCRGISRRGLELGCEDSALSFVLNSIGSGKPTTIFEEEWHNQIWILSSCPTWEGNNRTELSPIEKRQRKQTRQVRHSVQDTLSGPLGTKGNIQHLWAFAAKTESLKFQKCWVANYRDSLSPKIPDQTAHGFLEHYGTYVEGLDKNSLLFDLIVGWCF